MRARLALLAVLGSLTAAPLAAQQTAAPEINEWPVPWERTRPRDPFADGQGRVWFVGQTGHYVGMFDPRTQQFRRWELEPGVGPHNLIVDERGMVWFAGNLRGYIGRLNPRDSSIVRFPMPDTSVRDPHTLVFDGRGNIWFTAQGGNAIGRLRMASGEVQLVRVPTPRARPYGIWMAPDRRPWVVLFGTNKLATVDPGTLELTEIVLPRPEARPRRLAVTADGAVWYGDYAGGFLGRYDPAERRFEEWPLPGGARSRPYAVTLDDRGRIWLVETGAQPNRFVGFDTRTRQFLPPADVPSGAGTVRHMMFDPALRVIWFGTDANTIGRADVGRVQTSVP